MADTSQGLLDTMNRIKDGAKTGDADLKLSIDVRNSYVNAIRDFRKVLQDQVDRINHLPGYGEAGRLQSAQQTKSNLEHGTNALKRVIDDYGKYLDTLVDAVNEAAQRLIESG